MLDGGLEWLIFWCESEEDPYDIFELDIETLTDLRRYLIEEVGLVSDYEV